MKKFIILACLSVFLCGCKIEVRDTGERSTVKTIQSSNITHNDIRIDTITVHGNPHEILIRQDTWHPGNNGGLGFGGMMHSPECWCLKQTLNQ